jgi:hypothetical protein
MPTTRVLRGRLARATRTLNETGAPADAQALATLRRDYTAESLAEYVTRVVAKAPPLTDEQRARIAALLGGSPEAY